MRLLRLKHINGWMMLYLAKTARPLLWFDVGPSVAKSLATGRAYGCLSNKILFLRDNTDLSMRELIVRYLKYSKSETIFFPFVTPHRNQITNAKLKNVFVCEKPLKAPWSNEWKLHSSLWKGITQVTHLAAMKSSIPLPLLGYRDWKISSTLYLKYSFNIL